MDTSYFYALDPGRAPHPVIFPARRLAANGLEAWEQMQRQGYETRREGRGVATLNQARHQ
jgi:hypothetical protein